MRAPQDAAAMPSLSGPGSIAAVTSYGVLKAATLLNRILGATRMNAMSRMMGFMLICIGVLSIAAMPVQAG